MAIKDKLKELEDVKGFLGAGVFTPDGELIEGNAEISGLRMEVIGSLLNDVLLTAKEMTEKAGFGETDFIQINSDLGLLLARSTESEALSYHTVLFLKPDGNVAMGKMKLKAVAEELKEEF